MNLCDLSGNQDTATSGRDFVMEINDSLSARSHGELFNSFANKICNETLYQTNNKYNHSPAWHWSTSYVNQAYLTYR